jgi:hypothetical protein
MARKCTQTPDADGFLRMSVRIHADTMQIVDAFSAQHHLTRTAALIRIIELAGQDMPSKPIQGVSGALSWVGAAVAKLVDAHEAIARGDFIPFDTCDLQEAEPDEP